MSIFDNVKESLSRVGKPRESSEISHLLAEIKSNENEINDLYGVLGRAYYDSAEKNCEALADLCRKIDEKKARSIEIEDQVLQLRGQARCPGCGTIVLATAKFCSECGTRLPEPPKAEPPQAEITHATYCPRCGAMRNCEGRFCDICGFDYQTQMQPAQPIVPYCPNCQAKHNPEDRFCEICGFDYQTLEEPADVPNDALPEDEINEAQPEQAPREDSEAPTDFYVE